MPTKIKALPFQIIEEQNAVILRRGAVFIEISDENALLIISVIQKALAKQAMTLDEITALFAGTVKPHIERLIQHLLNKNFLVNSDEPVNFSPANKGETAQDIFYWHFNSKQADIAKILNEKIWAIVGINKLNRQLIKQLLNEGKKDIVVIDDPVLRNIELFDDDHNVIDEFWLDKRLVITDYSRFIAKPTHDIGFIIAASEFGSLELLREWNQFAITHAIPFYPLLLQNMIGYAGPLVLADEGACLECLKLRQNSNRQNYQYRQVLEQHASSGQNVAAYHEAMLTVLAAVGSFDLVKFKANIQWDIGTLCEIDLLSGSMTRRKVLKAPRCPVCSPIQGSPLINLQKQMTSDQAWAEIEQTVGFNE